MKQALAETLKYQYMTVNEAVVDQTVRDFIFTVTMRVNNEYRKRLFGIQTPTPTRVFEKKALKVIETELLGEDGQNWIELNEDITCSGKHITVHIPYCLYHMLEVELGYYKLSPKARQTLDNMTDDEWDMVNQWPYEDIMTPKVMEEI